MHILVFLSNNWNLMHNNKNLKKKYVFDINQNSNIASFK